jgi:hypothetical protein
MFLKQLLTAKEEVLWHISSRQELWSQWRKPLIWNVSANVPIARKQIRNMQQWSNWEAVFSTRSCNSHVMQQLEESWERCFLCSPWDSYMMQQSENCWERCFLCSPWDSYMMQQLEESWERCFLCSPWNSYMRGQLYIVS